MRLALRGAYFNKNNNNTITGRECFQHLMMQVKDFYMKTSFLIKIFASHQTPYRATHPVMAKTTILQESEKQNHVLDLIENLNLNS